MMSVYYKITVPAALSACFGGDKAFFNEIQAKMPFFDGKALVWLNDMLISGIS